MSSVTASRDSVKARMSKQRTAAVSKDTASSKRNQTSTKSPATPATKGKWASSTSLSTSISDTVSSGATVTNSTSLSESSSLLDAKTPTRPHRPTRKAPLPAVARQSTIKRNTARRAPAKDPPPPKQPDGWEADMEDAEPVVTQVKSSTDKSPRVTPVPDKKKVEEARKVLQESGVLGNQSTAAHFAALSDADYSLSPPSETHSHNSPQRADSTSAPGKEPSMGELRDSISMLQKQVADLRSDVPSVTMNPLREKMDMNRRMMNQGNSSSLSRDLQGGACGSLSQSSSSFAASADRTHGRQTKKVKKHTDGRSMKVPLPADLIAGRGGAGGGGLAAGQSSMTGMHSGALSKGLAEDGNESDGSASSFGLSCGLPGLSHEVADTITHLSAAETLQASVTVTPLSLRDWLLRCVPTPMDPSLTVYGAAVHNAHVACCEVVIGGLLSAIEDGGMERPPGLPCGTYDFRSRGISDQEGLQSVLRALASWMKTLEDDAAGKAPLAPVESFTGPQGSQAIDRASSPGNSILQDPRAVPLLCVLRSEALRIIGEEDHEQSAALSKPRAAHLNATDMLHVLTTALVPSFRQLVSRRVEAKNEETQRGVSPETDPSAGTSKSSSSLFSIPAGAIPEKAADMPEQPECPSAAVEAQVAARIAATGVRPENPCDPSEEPGSPTAADDMAEDTAAAAAAAADGGQKEQMRISPLAALTMLDMKKARVSMTGDRCDEEGGLGSVCSNSPMSRTGSISTDALTDALRKLVTAGKEDDSEGVDRVDVVEMLRQLAAERVAAKKRVSNGLASSARSSPDHASYPPDTSSECTAPSSVSDGASQDRSLANSEGSGTSATAAWKEKHRAGDKETEQLQAVELEKLLQHPAVMQMLAQMASSKGGGGMNPEELQMRQQEAAMYAAKERERAMRYERQIQQQQTNQRMMMNTFVNMNMMQNQMTNAMFSSMMSHPQPQQQQHKAVGVEKFAMLRSIAKRHGVQELSNLPLKQGASVMMGQAGHSMMSPAPMVPSLSMMPPPMPAQPRMQTPINRFASGITMPYLQVGGQTPLPHNAPTPASDAPVPAASSSTMSTVDASGGASASMSRSAPNLAAAPAPNSLVSRGSLPAPLPSGSRESTSMSGSGSGSISVSGGTKVSRSTSGNHMQPSSSSQSRKHKSSNYGMHGHGHQHPMQSRCMMAAYGGSGGGSMMNGMMPQQNMMGMHQNSASLMHGGMNGMSGSMMGGSYMGGMAQPPAMNGMMPQQGGSYMGGMQRNSYMGGGSYMGGMQPSMQQPMGGMGMGMPQMGTHPGMGNPYGGMPMQRSASLPHSQVHSQMRRQHSQSGSGWHSSGHSSSHRPGTNSHPAASMPFAQQQPQSQDSLQQAGPGQNPYYLSVPAPMSSDSTRSNGAGERKGRSSASANRQSSSGASNDMAYQAHDMSNRSSNSSSKERERSQSDSNGNSLSPGDKINPPPVANLNLMPVDPTNDTPPPVHGELLSSSEGSGSFLFDSAGSQPLAAAAAMHANAHAVPAATNNAKPQRQYKHLGSRNGRRAAPQLEATPEGDDESTMAGDSQILL